MAETLIIVNPRSAGGRAATGGEPIGTLPAVFEVIGARLRVIA